MFVPQNKTLPVCLCVLPLSQWQNWDAGRWVSLFTEPPLVSNLRFFWPKSPSYWPSWFSSCWYYKILANYYFRGLTSFSSVPWWGMFTHKVKQSLFGNFPTLQTTPHVTQEISVLSRSLPALLWALGWGAVASCWAVDPQGPSCWRWPILKVWGNQIGH